MKNYTNEVDVQIVIACLKKHDISTVIASPGTTNHTFIFSIQNDPFFTLYSCVDERSAAYMACGIAVESGKPVVLSCTAATASRNYFSALTEAYYRKIPILAITSTRTQCQVGNLIDQQIDRTVQPKDTVKLSVQLPYVKDEEDFWECEVKVNKAILELNHRGKGPVHINMPTRYDLNFDCKELPDVRCIRRYMMGDNLPELPKHTKIAIFIGSHDLISEELTQSIESFCETNNALVLCDPTSGYKGKYLISYYEALTQKMSSFSKYLPDLVIDMGEIAGVNRVKGKKTWRLSQDGEIRDPFKNLENVFEMQEIDFFNHYSQKKEIVSLYFDSCKEYIDMLRKIPVELPFSNIYIASKLHSLLPDNSVIHFGILNSLRAWSLFDISNKINSNSNVGGYGIDGCMSTLIGASLVNPKKLYFGVFGDLAFFYDMNSLGNRHIQNNLRILLINNGLGEEFKFFINPCYQWGSETNKYVAAEGHFGHKSPFLIKHFSEDLGFEYISASNKEEFENVYQQFICNENTRPILFEVFTNDNDENEALRIMMNKYESSDSKIKTIAKNILGKKGTTLVKKFLT